MSLSIVITLLCVCSMALAFPDTPGSVQAREEQPNTSWPISPKVFIISMVGSTTWLSRQARTNIQISLPTKAKHGMAFRSSMS